MSLNSTFPLASTFNSTSCHPLLLNMSITNPMIFREEFSQSSLQYGLCPETYIALSIASFVLFVYLVTTCIAMIGLVWQRKKTHIQARSLPLIIANTVANLTLVLLVALRVIVSKKYYPCFLLSLTFMLYPPLLTLPSILRGSRHYFLFRLNLMKKKVFGTSVDELSELQSISSMSVSGKLEHRRSNSSSSLGQLFSRTNSFSTTTSGPTSSTTAGQDNNNASSQEFLQIDEKQTNLEDILSRRDQLLMRFYEFMASYKFFITVYVVSFLIHLGLWAIVGGIEIGVYNSSGSWVFVESGFFEASHGCNITPKILIVLGIQAAFYLVWMFVINILCILSDRDTFNIKLEELILTVILIVALILYTIFGSIPVITTLVDYFVPYVLIFVVYSLLETIIGVILPVYYSIRDTMNETNHDSDKSASHMVKALLKEKKSLDKISDFARRSYCLEDVLAWKEIQNYKKMKKRKQAALDFIKTYLLPGAPLELNIPKSAATLANLREQMDSSTDEPPVNLFDVVEHQCLFNMTDLLNRLVVKDEYIAQKIAECTGNK
ncbi:predicted protein [Naegleria gruberi]|uniref:Predicted protein n=1 Tax=Naegleria gruberi TaxID=5762 RepID=D2V386_NAEGR|nr:uncharacterized protein NAEGRDRAFT_63267 [Naegleria gruberi]EFC48593.1 predicted protein [Naegleria gruberi]|eukprot:XP_002681337.1 predicted protein [Naegleria gruberi strain NEG-M]